MEIIAFVLIEVLPGKAREVAKAISTLDGVESSYSVTGPYDVIVTLKVADLKTLGELVSEKIQIVDGVATTFTCVVSG
ncbi:MAG: Lrp/AsnC ligand binding domain-containing protein [Gemmatimonadota bacterium]|nr:MAG: Lrp/AsnC ligand binding domain-containing protein [Gemmatimonadota bacterium]